MFSRLQIVVENDYGGKVAVPLSQQLGYLTCYANNNNGPRWSDIIVRKLGKYKKYDDDAITHSSNKTTSRF